MSLQLENGGGHVQVPRSLMQAFLRQDPNHPGVETVKLPSSAASEDPSSSSSPPLPSTCREVETELCLVCRRCGRAYPQESTLLAHQRSCYLGNQQRRGALRLVQSRYSCTLCDTSSSTRTYGSITEWRRHSETLQHRSRHEASQQERHLQQQQQQQLSAGSALSGDRKNIAIPSTANEQRERRSAADEEANPLVDEMEDVVNQITLLAARAAAESTTTTTTGSAAAQPVPSATQDNNNGPDVKRQKHLQEVAALAGAR